MYKENNWSATFQAYLARVSACLRLLCRKLAENMQKIRLFQNDSFYYFLWNVLILSISLFLVFDIPLDISFEREDVHSKQMMWIFTHNFAIFVYLIDIVSLCNTPYYSKGVFVKNRVSIIKHYFHKTFALDLAILLPLLLVTYEISENLLWRLNFLLVILKIKRIVRKIEDYFQFEDKNQGLFNLLKLLAQIIAMAHFFGCFWNYLAHWEINTLKLTDTWLHALEIQNAPWKIKYINSLYYSIVTMVTVGYGDISPQNTVEKTFAIVMIIFACGFFAYALNSVGQILKEMYRVDDEFR